MATVIDKWPESSRGRNLATGDRYPYNQWFDGQVWKLTRGVDFHIMTASMKTGIVASGRRRGITARCLTLDPDTILVQALLDS